MTLTDNVKTIKGVGDKTVKLLEKLGIYTVSDILAHYPRDYDEFLIPAPINTAQEGKIIAVEGVISRLTSKVGRRHIVTCYVSDATGALKLVWFNQPYRAKQFDEKKEYYFSGNMQFSYGRYQIQNPSAESILGAKGVQNQDNIADEKQYGACSECGSKGGRRGYQAADCYAVHNHDCPDIKNPEDFENFCRCDL